MIGIHFTLRGYWRGVISGWASIHSQVFNDPASFAADFAIISEKISQSTQYIDFVDTVVYMLTKGKKDSFIKIITPMVLASDKIKVFEGSLVVFI
ncbi:hypothetical protein D1631_05525 [Chryseobacterium nematophagum]|uniref:Uncharacterized protein n=1 Tax=Chryseobacterium nematophagum TaxID=2305228 RepID=A0A3M7TGT7_9FLAO|nr:hypothetical protein [Chryseobacterium nematophagum]RNA61430.1 hypothetical protein D1631_05525 [Chryseobacterium nematophagum]